MMMWLFPVILIIQKQIRARITQWYVRTCMGKHPICIYIVCTSVRIYYVAD